MKQTNNAIKFLMAQYRAIFKNAYFKGLTSAVLLTAGLAAGAAQAATVYLPVTDHNAITSSDSSNDFIIDGDAYFTGDTSTSSEASSVTIEQGGTLSNADGVKHVLAVKGNITLNGGTLDLTKSWIQGQETFSGSDSNGFTGRLIDRGNSTINLQNSLLQVASATLGEGTTVYIGGVADGAESGQTKGWNVASSALSVQASGADAGPSSILINGADITIDDDGLLTVAQNKDVSGETKSTFTMNAGTITLTGSALARRGTSNSDVYDITSDKDQEGNDIGAAIVSTNSAVANFNGGQIIVQDGDVGQIHGNNMNFKGTTFDNAGTMQIGNRLTVYNTLNDDGKITMTAGAINNTGTLLLGSALDNDGETYLNDGSTFTAKGGTITNASDGEIHVYSTLKMTGADIDNEGNLIVEDSAVFELDEQKDNKTVDGVLTIGGTVQVDGIVKVNHGTLDLSTATSITSQGATATLSPGDNLINVGANAADGTIRDAVLKLTEQQAHDFLNTPNFVSGEQRDSAGYIMVGKEGTVDFGDSVTLSNFNFAVHKGTNITDPAGQIIVYDSTGSLASYSGANFKATTMTLEDALLRADDNTVTDLPATTLHADNLNLHYDGVDTVEQFNGNFSFTKAVVGKNLDVNR